MYSPDLLFRIIIGLEDEATQHSRSIYSALDMLGDVGGLLDGLKLIGSLVMFLFHLMRGDPLNDFLLKAIFKRERRNKENTNDFDL